MDPMPRWDLQLVAKNGSQGIARAMRREGMQGGKGYGRKVLSLFREGER